MKKMLETKKTELGSILKTFSETENKIKDNVSVHNGKINEKFSELEKWKEEYNNKMDDYKVFIDERFDKMNETVEKKKKEYKDKVKKNFSKVKDDLKFAEKQKESMIELSQEQTKFWQEFVEYLNQIKGKTINVMVHLSDQEEGNIIRICVTQRSRKKHERR
jgi:F0F1-type ATP synthase membrane subunit b/b'